MNKILFAWNFATLAVVVGFLAAVAPALAEPIGGSDSAAQGETPRSSLNMTTAISRFKAGDYDGALTFAQRAAKEDRDLPPAQIIMAQLYSHAGDHVKMRDALQKATVDAPRDPEAYMLMGDIAMAERDLAKAESLFKKANELLPELQQSQNRKTILERRTHSGLAGTAAARNDWATAQKELEAVLKIDPQNVAATRQLASCLLRQNNEAGALEQLRRLAKLDLQSPSPEAELARLYQLTGDDKNVDKWLARALVVSPEDLGVRLAAGQWALLHGRTAEAQKQAITALRVSRGSPRATYFRGAVAMFERDYVTAESHFSEALKKSPSNVNISNALALAMLAQDDAAKTERALEYAEVNMRRQPNSAQAVATYGWALFKNNRLEEAAAALKKTSSLEKTDPDVAYFSACVAVASGRPADARPLLENALKSTSIFMFRQDAEELLKKLKG